MGRTCNVLFKIVIPAFILGSLGIGTAISLIIVGVQYLGTCEMERMLPLWFIVNGK